MLELAINHLLRVMTSWSGMTEALLLHRFGKDAVFAANHLSAKADSPRGGCGRARLTLA